MSEPLRWRLIEWPLSKAMRGAYRAKVCEAWDFPGENVLTSTPENTADAAMEAALAASRPPDEALVGMVAREINAVYGALVAADIGQRSGSIDTAFEVQLDMADRATKRVLALLAGPADKE